MKSIYSFIIGFFIALGVFSILASISGCAKIQNPVPGPQGQPGPQGDPGIGCTQTLIHPSHISGDPAEYGGSEIHCANSDVLITNGAPGQQGQQGLPGTATTAVQFCPGYTTTYPSSFPEFGFCSQGSIYAVYWDGHNAWLAEVVPGYYASTSTSAPCNFHVAANCVVTP